MNAGPSFRRELKAAWLERLKRARSLYAEKIAIRNQMVVERKLRPIDLAPDPDGRFALSLALKEESAARTEYMRLLRIFTELNLHRTPPEERAGSSTECEVCQRLWKAYQKATTQSVQLDTEIRSITEEQGPEKLRETTARADAAEQLRVDARQRLEEHRTATGHR